MKTTKLITKAALLSAVILGSVNAEYKLTDELSLSGYIDLAATYTPDDGAADSFNSEAVEVETAFAFNPNGSAFSALAELSFKDDGTSNEIDFETVTVTYTATDALSFSVGNIYTYQGMESFDAPGLYQYSYAGVGQANVASSNFDASGRLYSAAYAFGVGADYITDDYGFGLWVGESSESVSVEVMAQYTGIEGLTLKGIYADDKNYETINAWATYKFEGYTIGAEHVDTEYTNGDELTALVGLVNYSFGDAAITLRYTDAEYNTTDVTKFTVAPSYAFSENLLGLIEYSEVEVGDVDYSEYAAELIFTF